MFDKSAIVLLWCTEMEPLPELARPRKVPCYCVQMAVPALRVPHMEHSTDGEMTVLRLKGDEVRINSAHFHKLVRACFNPISWVVIKLCKKKEMFYLTMHSTHFNTVIWRRTCGIGPLV